MSIYKQEYYKMHKKDISNKAKTYYKINQNRIKENSKLYYEENKEKIQEKYQNIYKNRTEFINRMKCKPCTDCGKQYNHWVMHFDHLPDKHKQFNISKMKLQSISKIRYEISKCEVVCANCHSERTHVRLVSKSRNDLNKKELS